MRRIRMAMVVAALSMFAATFGTSAVGGSDADAVALARVIEKATGGAICKPRSKAKVIMWLVHATDRQADAMAKEIVFAAQANNITSPDVDSDVLRPELEITHDNCDDEPSAEVYYLPSRQPRTLEHLRDDEWWGWWGVTGL